MTTPCPSCGQPHGLVDALPQLLRSASEMVPGAPGLVHTLAEALGEAIRSWVLSPDTMPTPERSKPLPEVSVLLRRTPLDVGRDRRRGCGRLRKKLRRDAPRHNTRELDGHGVS